jgi:hypothetical protein
MIYDNPDFIKKRKTTTVFLKSFRNVVKEFFGKTGGGIGVRSGHWNIALLRTNRQA